MIPNELATCAEQECSSIEEKSGNDREREVVDPGSFEEIEVASRDESRPPLRKIHAWSTPTSCSDIADSKSLKKLDEDRPRESG